MTFPWEEEFTKRSNQIGAFDVLEIKTSQDMRYFAFLFGSSALF